jgi:hypothetical protein
MEDGAAEHNFEMGLPKDYPCQVCPTFKMADVTKNRNFFSCQFPLYYKSKWTQIVPAAIWQWVV